MGISLTLFNSVFDNKTHKRMDLADWQQFVDLLFDLSKIKREGKRDAQLMSPAIYKPDTTRANANVDSWAGWAAVDIDDYTVKGDLKDDLFNRFGDWEYICYSTASSSSESPKFRVIFKLGRVVEEFEIRHFWYALNTELEKVGDKQCKDLSRMYYIPADYNGANNFIFINHASSIDVDSLLSKHPYLDKKPGSSFLERLPDALRDQVASYRKDQLTETNFHWTGYRDCPFFPKQLAMEYQTISNTGWYYKMYQIMVATAGNATSKKYPITAQEIASLCRELDSETGNWYENRPIEREADRALEYVYKNM
tara:strand:+ start:609 stop:1538 length:930 start_codon:yes stop_codon:yes gene_type:complete